MHIARPSDDNVTPPGIDNVLAPTLEHCPPVMEGQFMFVSST
jgi:hypothetical protein